MESNANLFNSGSSIDLQDQHDQASILDDIVSTPDYIDHVPPPAPVLLPRFHLPVDLVVNRPPAKNLRALPYELVEDKFNTFCFNAFGHIPKAGDKDCWIHYGNIHGAYLNKNYPAIYIEKCNYRLSHIVKLIYNKITIWDLNEDQSDYIVCPGRVPRMKVDASHICHHPQCINPDHINFEATAINIARNSCFTKNRCNGHKGAPPCILIKKVIAQRENEKDDEISDFDDEISTEEATTKSRTRLGKDAIRIIKKYQFDINKKDEDKNKSLKTKRRLLRNNNN